VPVVRFIDRFLALAEKLFFVGANVALIVILVINIANISSRFLFGRGLIWVFPWTTVLFVWMVFLGFFVIYRRNRDIKVDILYQKFPPTIQNGVTIGTNVIIMTLMVVILLQAPNLLPRQVGNIDYVGLQRYWFAVPFYVSCGLIMLDFLRDTGQRLLVGPPAEGERQSADLPKTVQ
jgi:TRAP-type C4-dicarboxylate transport system permease small subunit